MDFTFGFVSISAVLGFALRKAVSAKITSCSTMEMKPRPKPSRELLVPLHPPINDSSKTHSSSKQPSSPPPPSQNSSEVGNNPWMNKRYSHNEIKTEEELERFLAEVDEKLFKSAPPTTISRSARSAPLKAVRMSVCSRPKNVDTNELPPPMTLEESIQAFRHLGIYPEIENWRDNLRQWFSSLLLNPLLNKINTSHERVMETAAKLGVSVTVSPVGNNAGFNEDGVLNQLKASLIHFQKKSQSVLILQDCIDAITQHQRLQSLVKGEWGKGLLPRNSIPADYTVQRIRELAKGTCVKNFEYLGSENKELSDSHLLLYLFCAFLEHPSWMLHVDSHAKAHSSENPLFLGVLPQKEAFTEKYIAVKYGFPSVLHSGACVLAVGKQSLPVFALYWDENPQFSLQGRTALWDSILLLCFKIRASYGEVVRGIHLGSSVLDILPVFYSDIDEE